MVRDLEEFKEWLIDKGHAKNTVEAGVVYEFLLWMIKYKFAKNEWNADNIFGILELGNYPRFWERARRVVLYRLWRLDGVDPSVAKKLVDTGVKPRGVEDA